MNYSMDVPSLSLRWTRRAGMAGVLCALIASGCNRQDRSGLAVEIHPAALSPQPAPAAELLAGSAAEAYKDYGRNPWVASAVDRFSTFAADVDTASYTIARRKLRDGTLPPAASVRVEEFVNYFRYGLPDPDDGPFSVVAEAAPSPSQDGKHIVRIGVATKAKSRSERKPMNLVFLVDTSGSMMAMDKLGLAKRALHLLVDNLQEGDAVALATYAGRSAVILPSTTIADRDQILAAINSLGASGSTAMASGIELAYREAAKNARPEVISRVIVLSDGDANVGATSHEQILQIIAEHARTGIALSTIGFGMGNYKDEMMEQLADRGDGNAFYIDSFDQAKRVFQEQLGSMLEVVAKDVKLQVEFDPLLVARYRLLGYENRNVADRDFRNDQVDAGEIGAGHQVTALYEVELTEVGRHAAASLLSVRVRHKAPSEDLAKETVFVMPPSALASSFAAASSDFRFACAVAAFADVLRGGEDATHWSLSAVRAIATAAAGEAVERRELLALIDTAMALSGKSSGELPGATASPSRPRLEADRGM